MGLMYTPHTVTVVNAYDDNGTMVYKATVLSGVFLDVSHSALAESLGAKNADSATLFVPFDVATGKTFATPKEYKAAADKSALWTLQEAGESSVVACYFVRGSLGDGVSYREAVQQYSDVYKVKSVLVRDFGSADMQHWEVRGA